MPVGLNNSLLKATSRSQEQANHGVGHDHSVSSAYFHIQSNFSWQTWRHPADSWVTKVSLDLRIHGDCLNCALEPRSLQTIANQHRRFANSWECFSPTLFPFSSHLRFLGNPRVSQTPRNQHLKQSTRSDSEGGWCLVNEHQFLGLVVHIS